MVLLGNSKLLSALREKKLIVREGERGRGSELKASVYLSQSYNDALPFTPCTLPSFSQCALILLVSQYMMATGMSYFAEFALVETHCPMGSRIIPEACKPLCPDRAVSTTHTYRSLGNIQSHNLTGYVLNLR